MNSTYEDPFFLPQVNVFISDSGDLTIKVDISGIKSGDVEVTAEGNRLKIKGRRSDPDAKDARSTLINEIPVGPFEAILEIPHGFELSKVQSTYREGVLRVNVPPKARRSGRDLGLDLN